METKRCPCCGETKTLDLYYKSKASKLGVQSHCKVCCNLRTTSYAKENASKIQPKLFGYALKRRYGISVEDYEALLIKQDYKCGICETTECPSGRNFAVDHNHTTGKIRGLLCSRCNTAIGQFKESPKIIEDAIKYLEQYA